MSSYFKAAKQAAADASKRAADYSKKAADYSSKKAAAAKEAMAQEMSAVRAKHQRKPSDDGSVNSGGYDYGNGGRDSPAGQVIGLEDLLAGGTPGSLIAYFTVFGSLRGSTTTCAVIIGMGVGHLARERLNERLSRVENEHT